MLKDFRKNLQINYRIYKRQPVLYFKEKFVLVLFFSSLIACTETSFESSNEVTRDSKKEVQEKDIEEEEEENKRQKKLADPENEDDDDEEPGEEDPLPEEDEEDIEETVDEYPSGSDVEIDEGALSSTAGQLVDVVGIHFEDGSDGDFNDLSICFKGKFKVDGINIVSMAKQTVNLTTKRISGVAHTFVILFKKEDGSTLERLSDTPERNIDKNYQAKLLPKTKLTVETSTTNGVSLNLNSKGNVRVELNICRNTGT